MVKRPGERKITLRGDFITLAQAVKAADLADSGGMAKVLVRDGKALVNGETVLQPGKKLRAGDRFRLEDSEEWTVTS